MCSKILWVGNGIPPLPPFDAADEDDELEELEPPPAFINSPPQLISIASTWIALYHY
jgi:hypothetical protein